MKKLISLLFLMGLCLPVVVNAQVPTAEPLPSEIEVIDDDDEDYDLYGDVEFADSKSKSYANARIFGGSPQRFVSVGWDIQGPYDMNFSALGAHEKGSDQPTAESARARYTGGLRLMANIPVISKANFTWQLGATYWDTRYSLTDIQEGPNSAGALNTLNERGLRTSGLNTTLYKPLNEYHFVLFQGSVDMSGDYGFGLQSEVRGSAALLVGKRPSDRKQWGVGVARTYRVGAMNYIPIVMYNYTSANRKWGIEALLPARAAYRYNFSTRSMLLAGFELEGQSYRLASVSAANNSFEIRRGEIRPRLEYQRQLFGFFWLGAQVGYRINYSFDGDNLPNGREFYRGFFGDQPMAMINTIGNAPYAQITINFVSP